MVTRGWSHGHCGCGCGREGMGWTADWLASVLFLGDFRTQHLLCITRAGLGMGAQLLKALTFCKSPRWVQARHAQASLSPGV